MPLSEQPHAKPTSVGFSVLNKNLIITTLLNLVITTPLNL